MRPQMRRRANRRGQPEAPTCKQRSERAGARSTRDKVRGRGVLSSLCNRGSLSPALYSRTVLSHCTFALHFYTSTLHLRTAPPHCTSALHLYTSALHLCTAPLHCTFALHFRTALSSLYSRHCTLDSLYSRLSVLYSRLCTLTSASRTALSTL